MIATGQTAQTAATKAGEIAKSEQVVTVQRLKDVTQSQVAKIEEVIAHQDQTKEMKALRVVKVKVTVVAIVQSFKGAAKDEMKVAGKDVPRDAAAVAVALTKKDLSLVNVNKFALSKRNLPSHPNN